MSEVKERQLTQSEIAWLSEWIDALGNEELMIADRIVIRCLPEESPKPEETSFCERSDTGEVSQLLLLRGGFGAAVSLAKFRNRRVVVLEEEREIRIYKRG